MSRDVRVFLTGGLGNQLFQLAAGLSALDEICGRVLLDTKLGKPRTTLGAADVLHFRLPENVIEYSRIPTPFRDKSFSARKASDNAKYISRFRQNRTFVKV
jgi:hypothetical protein